MTVCPNKERGVSEKISLLPNESEPPRSPIVKHQTWLMFTIPYWASSSGNPVATNDEELLGSTSKADVAYIYNTWVLQRLRRLLSHIFIPLFSSKPGQPADDVDCIFYIVSSRDMWGLVSVGSPVWNRYYKRQMCGVLDKLWIYTVKKNCWCCPLVCVLPSLKHRLVCGQPLLGENWIRSHQLCVPRRSLEIVSYTSFAFH